MTIVTYIDDCILHWNKDQNAMDEFAQSLKDDGDSYNWEHTVEGAVITFLGIDFHHHAKKNQYKLTQTGLVDKILEAANIHYCNEKPTPCSLDGKPLGTDKGGPVVDQERSYPTVIGMLLYLVGNSRPDIALLYRPPSSMLHLCSQGFP
jgi:hypothetical protein